VVYAKAPSPFREVQSLPIEFDPAIGSGIRALLEWSSPSAVASLIVAAILDPV
jgi:hypothetical protein